MQKLLALSGNRHEIPQQIPSGFSFQFVTENAPEKCQTLQFFITHKAKSSQARLPSEHHDAEAVLGVERCAEVVAAELEDAEEGEVVGGHEELVHVGVADVDAPQVRVLDEQQQDLGADARYHHVALLARVERRCEQRPAEIQYLYILYR